MAMARAMMQESFTGQFGRHGGQLSDAMRAWPDAPRPWLDLSTGINPVAWVPPAGLVVDDGPLPDVGALAGLEAVAARYFGVPAEYVVAVPGSEIALRLLPMLGLPGPIAAVVPSYGTHVAVADAVISRADLTTARKGTVLLANPNNPDGAVLAASEVHVLAGCSCDRLVIDEAFADASPDVAVLPTWDRERPLVVLRSFGKFFGLAGVRLGFVVATGEVLLRLRLLLGDWPVSAQAIAWGTAAYSDASWIAATRARLVADAARLDALLARYGLVASGDSSLFRLVTSPDAPAVFERLARAGILTRPFSDRADWLRFGLPGDEAGFARLERALADG